MTWTVHMMHLRRVGRKHATGHHLPVADRAAVLSLCTLQSVGLADDRILIAPIGLSIDFVQFELCRRVKTALRGDVVIAKHLAALNG